MQNSLEHVASLGSGRTAYIDGYRVGGKTGTNDEETHCPRNNVTQILRIITLECS